MPKSYSLEAQSNGRVQVVQTDQCEDNRSIVHRLFKGICSVGK